MKKSLISNLGLVLLLGAAFLGRAAAIAKADDAGCCGASACPTCCGNNECHCRNECCPHCGCKLVPYCQITCTTKKTTEHKYCCGCKEICVPGVTRICDKCNECCENGGQENCDCHCRIHEVHKLMIHPVTKETPVKQCTVLWVCPTCSNCATTAPAPAAATPMAPGAPPTPAPNANRLPPPPKTTDAAPRLEDVRIARSAF